MGDALPEVANRSDDGVVLRLQAGHPGTEIGAQVVDAPAEQPNDDVHGPHCQGDKRGDGAEVGGQVHRTRVRRTVSLAVVVHSSETRFGRPI